MLYPGGSSGVGGRTALCKFIEENGIELPKDVAAQIVGYVALSLLEDGDYAGALSVLRQAESRGIRDDRLEELREKLDAIMELQQAVADVMSDINRLFSIMGSQDRVDEAILSKLGQDIAELEAAINKARSLGINTDDRVLSYAQDIYNIMNIIKEEYSTTRQAADLLQRFNIYVIGKFSNINSAEDLADALKGLQQFGVEAANILGTVQRGIEELEGLQLKTAEARQVRDQILTRLQTLLPLLRIVNTIGVKGGVLGVWLGQVQGWVRDAYENPSNSPFGAARDNFINVVSSMLNGIRDLRRELKGIPAPAGAGQEMLSSIEALKEFGLGITESLEQVLKSTKYYTTFNDYRWNELWEAAESKAGYDLGHISKADVQRYEYKCDNNGCRLEERGGVTGWLARHAPEELLEFWTTVEDALQDIEMYNRWTMNYAKNPILKALGHLGYIGAGIVVGIGSMASPRMLADQMNVLKDLVEQWGRAIYHHNLDELKNVANTTWRMLFGSKEAALTMLGAALLFLVDRGLLLKKTPEGKIPLWRSLLSNVLQGDIIGLGLEIVARGLPLARLGGIARSLIENGIIRASRILDDAGIMARVLKKAGKIERIKALLHADKLHDVISMALKNADNLRIARANMERVIREMGVEGVAEEAAKYRAAKTTTITNLESLKVHAPTRLNKLRNLARRLLRKDVPVEELPRAVREDLGRVKPAEELAAEARKLTAESGETLAQKLAARRVVGEEAARALRTLDDVISSLEKQGRRGLAEALRRFRENFERLAAETERLADIKKTLDELDRLRALAKKEGLWKDVVELNKRKKLPGRGWLRRKRLNLEEYLSKYREKVAAKYRRRLELKKRIEKQLNLMANKLELLGEARVDLFIKNLRESLKRAGFEDLAVELEKAARENAKLPLSARLGLAVQRLADRMLERLERARHQVEQAIDEAEVQARASEVEREFPGATISGRLMAKLGRAYLAGLRVAERLVEQLDRLGRALEDAGLKRMRPELETRMVERLAELLEKEYSRASLENLAFLKGLRKALEAYEKTPIGTLLSELDRAVSRTIEAVEKPLKSRLENMRLRKLAHERLTSLLSQNGVVVDIARSLARKLDELAGKMEKSLESTPHGSEILDRAYRMAESGASPEEVVGELKRYAQSKGYQVPDTFWRALEEYVETRQAARELNALAKLAMEKGYLTLDDVQRAVNRLARIDLDLAWKADWITIKSYLDDLMRELAEARELARQAGASDVLKSIEETERAIRQVEVKRFERGPFSELTAETRIPRGYSQIAETLEGIYDILKRGLGEEKVKGLRRLLDEFEAKLENGVFDEKLLKKMRWELRKIKLRNIHKALRAELDRLLNRLGEIAARVRGGRQAALIERALNELADEIRRVEEELEVEKGWVGLDRLVEVSNARYFRVPKEFAERVARILQEREKTIRFKTREGHTVTMRRRIEVKPDGTMHIRYELEFPGKRRVVYDEIVAVDRTGKVHVYKHTFHDPEVAKAIEAYEEARRGLREMDELALQGKEIEEVLRKSLAELDPDYEILSRIAFVEKGSLKPVTAPLLAAGIEVLDKIVRGAPAALGALGAIGSELERDLQQKVKELLESLPPEFFAELRDAVERLTLGTATEQDKLLLSLTAPLVIRLSPLYSKLGESSGALPERLLAQIQHKVGPVAGGAPLDPEKYKLAVEWPGGKPETVSWKWVYIVLPEPDSSVVPVWVNPDYIARIKVPGGGEVELPAFDIGGSLVVLLPPFAVQVPEDVRHSIEAQLPQIERPQTPYMPVQPIAPPGGGGAGGAAPLIPPIIPELPWGGGAWARSSIEKERLNIV